MNILLMTSAAPLISPFSTREKRPPIGIGYLISVLKRNNHKVYFEDNYLKPSNIFENEFIIKNNIDWIGIYANTICYQKTLEMLNKLQNYRERKVWNGKIMVGGPHVSVGLDTIPDFVNNVLIGEGEISILKIVTGEISERVITGEKVKEMDLLPSPAWEEFIYRPYDWASERLPNSYPMYTFNTSRGCPFNCTFCSVNSIWGNTYRYMSGERVLSEVERMIKDYGMRGAYFREDHFTMNKKRVVDFCEGLLNRNINLNWMCESRVDNFDDEEYIKLMARAGCKAFYIGVESGSPRMLKFMKKGETVDQFIRAFNLTKKHGINTYASFVVGVPTETSEDVKLTKSLIDNIQPDFYNLNVYTGIPGSELYEYVKENKLYEFKDQNGLLYLKGHDKRINQFANGNPKMKIPYLYRLKIFILKEKIKYIYSHSLKKIRKYIINMIPKQFLYLIRYIIF